MGRSKATRKKEVPLKSKLKKDPGVPRLPDLKVKVHNAQKKAMVGHLRRDLDSSMASEPTLSTLAMLASSAAAAVTTTNAQQDLLPSSESKQKTKEQTTRQYLRTLHRVVDESDIVVLVLDARDPEGCRSRLVEEEVRRREAEGKRLVFVLNKIDLVPRSNAQAWLKHLRHSTPTLPFLSSASRRSNASSSSTASSSTAPALLRLLKSYKPTAGSVTIGVVGYPNVGKSSLINSLKRSKVCAVAAQPGHTKDLQHIQLERGMRIIDSPGVVFDDADDYFDGGKGMTKGGNVLLRNVIKVEDVEDPISIVEEICSRTPHSTMRGIYDLLDFSSPLEFLTMLALSSGRLLKGGTPDLNSTARQVIKDWNQHKIPYFSEPPAIHPSMIPSTVPSTRNNHATPTIIIAPGAENVGQAQIVSELAKPFELEGLFSAADAGAFSGRTVAVAGAGAGAAGEMDDDDMIDEPGDVFWDAMEGPEEENRMDDQSGVPMERDDDDDDVLHLKHVIPHKRSRSPSTTTTTTAATAAAAPTATADSDVTSRHVRQPKRQRKSKDVPAYDSPLDEHVLRQMGQRNPLSRRVLKREAKRARKALRVRGGGGGGGRRRTTQGGGDVEESMDVDVDTVDTVDGLQFTFMA